MEEVAIQGQNKVSLQPISLVSTHCCPNCVHKYAVLGYIRTIEWIRCIYIAQKQTCTHTYVVKTTNIPTCMYLFFDALLHLLHRTLRLITHSPYTHRTLTTHSLHTIILILLTHPTPHPPYSPYPPSTVVSVVPPTVTPLFAITGSPSSPP